MFDDHDQSIARAFVAVQRHVLPGLETAWDEAGPAVLWVTELVVTDLWGATGYPPLERLKAEMTALELKLT